VSAFLRLIAAFVVVVLAGLPVAGVVCAHECLTPADVAAAPDDHCHDPGPTDSTSIRDVPVDGCSTPLAFAEVATRDRVSASVTADTLALPSFERSLFFLVSTPQRAFTPHPPRFGPGLSAGAIVPLRI
jgi:hypothetical protein